jgi:hypothetical protein
MCEKNPSHDENNGKVRKRAKSLDFAMKGNNLDPNIWTDLKHLFRDLEDPTFMSEPSGLMSLLAGARTLCQTSVQVTQEILHSWGSSLKRAWEDKKADLHHVARKILWEHVQQAGRLLVRALEVVLSVMSLLFKRPCLTLFCWSLTVLWLGALVIYLIGVTFPTEQVSKLTFTYLSLAMNDLPSARPLGNISEQREELMASIPRGNDFFDAFQRAYEIQGWENLLNTSLPS